MNRSTFTGRSHRLSSSSRIRRAALMAVPAVAMTWAFAPDSANAASRYWDLNGATAGATDVAGGDVSGTWNVANPNWTLDSGGITATASWLETDTAVFSAGTNGTGVSTITVSTAGGAISSVGLTLQEGTLTFAGDALTLTGATLNASTANNSTFTNVLNSAVGITKSGAGVVTLKGANTITGATAVSGGTLNLDYTANSTAKIDAASALSMSGSGAINVIGANGATDTVQTVSGVNLSGGTSISATKGDTGNTTLSLGAINRNALAVVDFNTAGTGAGTASITATAADGLLGPYATFGKQDWANVTGGNITALTTYAANDFTNAANNVDVTSNQSPTADFTVNTLRFNTAAPVTLNLSGANNTASGILVGSGVGANTVTLAGGGITAPAELIVQQHNTAAPLVVDAGFTGAAAVTKAGAGLMVLNGANTNAAFNIVAGTLRVGANERIADTAIVNVAGGTTFDLAGRTETIDRLNGSGTLTFNGGTLGIANPGATTFGAAVTIPAAGGTLSVVNATGNLTVNSAITNTAGAFTKTGPGTLTLRGNMVGNATSVVRIEGGVFNIESSLRFGTQGKVVLDNGATLEQVNSGWAGSFMSLNTGLEIGPNGGTIKFDVPYVSNVSGLLTYGGANANGTIGGTGTLTKTGVGEFRYQGAGLPNTSYSKLVVKGGVFRLAFNSSIQDERGFGAVPAAFMQDQITLDGGAIATSFNASFSVLHANRGVTLGPAGGSILSNMTIPGKITGVGDLKALSGTVVLGGANDFTGNLFVNSTVQLNENMTIGGIAGSAATPQSATIGADKTLTAGVNNQDTTLLGQLGGATGSFNKVGTGMLTLTGNDFSNGGTTTISGGTIKFGAASAGLSNTSALNITAAGTLDAAGVPDTVGSLEGAGPIINGVNFTVAGVNAAPVTYSGNYSGTGAFTKQGAGVQNLAGTNTFASVTVDGGTLGVHSSGALAGNLSVQNDARVQYLPTVTGTIASKVGTVAVGAAAKIDLVDNKLITSSPVGTFVAGAYTEVSGLVDTARGNLGTPAWNGASGITTSDARAQGSNLVSIGVAKVGQIKGVADGATTTFAGQTVLGSDTVAMVTWGGDATLDGKINIDDYGRIDANVSQSGTVFGWYNGDFNYDGAINIDDYGIIDGNIANQGTAFVTSGGAVAAAEGVSAVPEPASLSVLALGALGLMRRRRRA